MSGRWPEPVRPPLENLLVDEADIEQALRLTGRFLTEPEDPAFDPMTFGLLCAARAALIECADVLRMELQVRAAAHTFSSDFVDMHAAQAVVARRVARRVIDELRQWLPRLPGE